MGSVEGPLKKPQINGRSQTAVISFVVDVSSELKAHPLNLCVFVSVCVFLYTYSTMRVSNEPKVCPISMYAFEIFSYYFTYSNLHVPSRLKACPISMYRALGHIIPAAGLRAIHVYDSIQAFGTPETFLRGNRAHTS